MDLETCMTSEGYQMVKDRPVNFGGGDDSMFIRGGKSEPGMT